jgi:hypothetical protein
MLHIKTLELFDVLEITCTTSIFGNPAKGFHSFLSNLSLYQARAALLVLLLLALVNLDDRRKRREHGRPDQLELVLTSVQAVTEPHSPHNVEVCSSSSHEMPPSVSLEEDTPRQSDFVTPLTQLVAVHIIQCPEAKSTQEDGQSTSDHEPHGLDDLAISVIPTLLFLLTDSTLQACGFSCLCSGADITLHNVHGSEQDGSSQKRIHVLVEDGVSEVVVVARDEHRQRHEEESQEDAECTCLLVREGGVEHETGRVDH